MKLGSLFDGSGGFPLAGAICGIEPVWASEIEPFPIRVTTKRFHNVKHLGSVTDINGAEIEPVDIITFGSPCQDLSVAGKRAGLHDGERSNLFFQAIRIIKEMRNHDRAAGRADVDCRPRYIVWENVPGAYSSNGGEDFRCVLEEICKVADPEVSIPRPDKGKWEPAGCILADGYSVAWRTFDAQYWGVPQRRRRIYLVADFAGQRAGEILFEQDGLRGNSQESGAAREGVATDVERSAGGSGEPVLMDAYQHHGWRVGTACNTLTAGQNDTVRGDTPLVVAAYSFDSLSSNSMKSSNPYSGCRQVDIAKCLDTTAPNPCKNQGGIAVVEKVYALQANGIDRADTAGCNGAGWREDKCYTLNTIDRHAVCYDARGNGDGRVCPTITGDHNNRVTDFTALCVGNGQMCNITMAPVANTLDCMHDQQAVLYQDTTGALCARDYKGVGNQYVDENKLVIDPTVRYIVRRLTPVECARLQGFPDWWCMGLETPEPTEEDIVWAAEVWERWRLITSPNTKPKSRNQLIKWLKNPYSDAAEYKLWGNGIALPCAARVMEGIMKEEKR